MQENVENVVQVFLRIHIGHEIDKIALPISNSQTSSGSSFVVKVDTILELVNESMQSKKISLNKFLNVWVDIQKRRVNLLKIKRQSLFNLRREEQSHYLDILVTQAGGNTFVDRDKAEAQLIVSKNALLELSALRSKYQQVKEKLSRVNEVFKREMQMLNKEEIYSIDIAYLFAEPLCQPELTKQKCLQLETINSLELVREGKYRKSKNEVSFQKEYDRFVRVLREKLFGNINVEMLVASENSIRQVLIQGCRILHFSSHGQREYLKIEQDRNVGFEDFLTADRLIRLLDGKQLPQLIIFNACFSAQIAQKVHTRFPQVITFGYDGEANDKYCQLFTEKFYEGIYKGEKSIGEIYDSIVLQVKTENPQDAAKMRLYTRKEANTRLEHDRLSTSERWNVEWAYLENLGANQPFGIKKHLFDFIREYLLSAERQFFFVTGQRGSGKSLFVRKAVYYTMHRNVFKHGELIDCLQPPHSPNAPVTSLLKLKLLFQQRLLSSLRACARDSTNVVLVLDHCDAILRNQPQEFLLFLHSLWRNMRFGKIIIVAEHIESLKIGPDAALKEYHKEKLTYNSISKDLNKHLIRWHPKITNNPKLFQQYPLHVIMKALKNSTTDSIFLGELRRQTEQHSKSCASNDQLLVDRHHQFAAFASSMHQAHLKLKTFVKNGFYSRTHLQFPLLSFMPNFQLPWPSGDLIRVNEQIQKSGYSVYNEQQGHYNKANSQKELLALYDDRLKHLTQELTSSLGKFSRDSYSDDWYEQQFLFIIEKVFIVVNICFIVKEKIQDTEAELFKCHSLYSKMYNDYQNLFQRREKLGRLLQLMKLKVYLTLYSIYKRKCFDANLTDLNSFIQERFTNLLSLKDNITSELLRSSVFQNSQSDIFIQPRIQNVPAQSSQYSMNFNFSDVEGNNDSNNREKDKEVLESIFFATNHFKMFQNELHEQYRTTEFWDLIQKITEMDSLIRLFSSQYAPIYEQSVQPSQYKRRYEQLRKNIIHFYDLWQSISDHYHEKTQIRPISDHDHEKTQIRSQESERSCSNKIYRDINKVFYEKDQITLACLCGLHFLDNFISEFIDNEHFFEYEEVFKPTIRLLRKKLRFSEVILQKIYKKITVQEDFSYKKIYRFYLQMYVNLRFKIQKKFITFQSNTHKESLSMFTKLLKLTQEARLLQQCNRIKEFIENSFYNKCTILISQPLGYLLKKKKSLNQNKNETGLKSAKQTAKMKNETGNFSKNKNSANNFNKKQNKIQTVTSKQEQQQKQEQLFFQNQNVVRYSDLLLKIQQNTQSKVQNQIHIEIQAFTQQKLFSSKANGMCQNQGQKKSRLIYLLMCDCRNSETKQWIYLQSLSGYSVRYDIRNLTRDSRVNFPIAPVIIIFGEDSAVIKQFYRRMAQQDIKFNNNEARSSSEKKIISKMALICFNRRVLSQASGKFEQISTKVWKNYTEKQVSLNLLSFFFSKFCKVYFDEKHKTFEQQVIRSFNIARKQANILGKKMFCQGMQRNKFSKLIDQLLQSDQQHLSLQFLNVKKNDKPVEISLNGNARSNMFSKELQRDRFSSEESPKELSNLIQQLNNVKSSDGCRVDAYSQYSVTQTLCEDNHQDLPTSSNLGGSNIRSLKQSQIKNNQSSGANEPDSKEKKLDKLDLIYGKQIGCNRAIINLLSQIEKNYTLLSKQGSSTNAKDVWIRWSPKRQSQEQQQDLQSSKNRGNKCIQGWSPKDIFVKTLINKLRLFRNSMFGEGVDYIDVSLPINSRSIAAKGDPHAGIIADDDLTEMASPDWTSNQIRKTNDRMSCGEGTDRKFQFGRSGVDLSGRQSLNSLQTEQNKKQTAMNLVKPPSPQIIFFRPTIKRIVIYDKVKPADLLKLFESLNLKQKCESVNKDQRIFRIIFVDDCSFNQFHQQASWYNNSSSFENNNDKQVDYNNFMLFKNYTRISIQKLDLRSKNPSIENLNHICAALFYFSKRIENFSDPEKELKKIFAKKESKQQIGKLSAKQLKDKIIQYYQRCSHSYSSSSISSGNRS